VNGFDVLVPPAGRWPKLMHRETGIQVDVLPEGGRPGTPARPAPTTIAHPSKMGAVRGSLRYISLPALVELKLAAARLRDEADVVELARENPDRLDGARSSRSRPSLNMRADSTNSSRSLTTPQGNKTQEDVVG
jgi:hypothetical protein